MEPAKQKSRTGLILLVFAGLILVAAVSWAAFRGADSEKNTASPAASPLPGQPANLATIEERTRAEPGNPDAWLALGQAQFDAGRFAEAARAYERGTAFAGGRADIWSALGEARVMASADSPMPAAALADFRKAAAIDPKDPRARYFLAVARDLAGDHRGAIGDWFALLQDTPPGAPWEQDLRRTIEQVGKINTIEVAERLAAVKQPAPHPLVPGGSTATAPIPGPNAEQMRTAAALPPHEQDAMVQNMVAGLEAKLQANPGNVDGWIMLMRSRMTLGESARASAALKAAVAANPGDTARLRAEAAALGVR
ncbi:MAG: tetratricopeptide repeat protein [Sphingomonas sp.]|jgi:cytochrome c-type biogenesis protein CcmH|uniref:tetratricopeptide repeat protein n=1 Tax=Sphingomonas sp. TaxID=28214 RepID=UPI003563FEBE